MARRFMVPLKKLLRNGQKTPCHLKNILRYTRDVRKNPSHRMSGPKASSHACQPIWKRRLARSKRSFALASFARPAICCEDSLRTSTPRIRLPRSACGVCSSVWPISQTPPGASTCNRPVPGCSGSCRNCWR